VRQLVKVAGDHNGAFRPEITRQLRALGDKSVPALIETRKDSSSELRHWAYNQLEAMGKRIPGDAVQTKDNQVLADVLHAYGTIHDLDAVPVILSFVSSDRVQVRTAARESLTSFGQDAVWKLREAYANLTGKAARKAGPRPTSRRSSSRPTTAFACRRSTAFSRTASRRRRRARSTRPSPLRQGPRAAASARPSRGDGAGLSRAGFESRRERRAGGAGDAPQGRAHRPRRTSHRTCEAEIAYLEGKELVARGIPDAEPFKRALALDPTHVNARAELARLEASVDERQSRTRTVAAAAGVLLVAVIGILLFGGRRRRPRTTEKPARAG